MSTYLLDTCAISDFFLGVGSTKEKLIASTPASIAISSVSVMEVLYGLHLNPAARKKLSQPFSDLCSTVRILDFDNQVAETAAEIRAKLKKNGTPVGSFDLLIGATAITHKCVLVTSNVREFRNIDELVLENWR
jgi:tRNA(fMet)-specific endonuclease VapC